MLGTEAIYTELSRALDLTELRHAVYAANIANASTDGYRRLEVQAADEAGLLAADAGGLGADLPVGLVVPSADDTVRLDREMAGMAQNSLRFQTLLGAFERMTGLLKLAIHEGKGG